MERPHSRSENGNGRSLRPAKNREVAQGPPPIRMLAVPPMVRPPANEAELLAAIAVDLKVRLRSADMPVAMQERAFRCAGALLGANLERKIANPTHIAMSLKKEFDAVYGPAWHCVVGKSFGSFVTHSGGGFLYFSVDKLCFLLFKTEVRPLTKWSPPLLKLGINA